jgi:hypothetical protein
MRKLFPSVDHPSIIACLTAPECLYMHTRWSWIFLFPRSWLITRIPQPIPLKEQDSAYTSKATEAARHQMFCVVLCWSLVLYYLFFSLAILLSLLLRIPSSD